MGNHWSGNTAAPAALVRPQANAGKRTPFEIA
jgi:hypothetical protein